MKIFLILLISLLVYADNSLNLGYSASNGSTKDELITIGVNLDKNVSIFNETLDLSNTVENQSNVASKNTTYFKLISKTPIRDNLFWYLKNKYIFDDSNKINQVTNVIGLTKEYPYDKDMYGWKLGVGYISENINNDRASDFLGDSGLFYDKYINNNVGIHTEINYYFVNDVINGFDTKVVLKNKISDTFSLNLKYKYQYDELYVVKTIRTIMTTIEYNF